MAAQFGGCPRFGSGLLLPPIREGQWFNHGYFSKRLAYHAHLVAGAERHGCEAVVCHVFDAEVAFVVQQA